MDGTLTIPMLRFKEMRARLGLAPNQDILPTVQSFPPDKRASAMAIIEEMEEECANMMQVRSYSMTTYIIVTAWVPGNYGIKLHKPRAEGESSFVP